MNRLIIVLLTVLFSHTLYCTSLSVETRSKEEKLNILHSLNPITATSLDEPIELYINEEGNLRLQFNQNFGEVTIQIIDLKDIPFYESIIHSNYEKEINIQSSVFPTGSYTIYLHIDDYYMYAQFRIQ